MNATAEYLKKAITGETNAAIMYSKFSQIAEAEGYPGIASLFMALKKAELIHIKNHRQALGDNKFMVKENTVGTDTTLNNLENAYNAEMYEYKKMYPSFLKSIKSEINNEYGKVGQLSMQWAAKTELTHAKILKRAIKYLKKGIDFYFTEIFICEVCGNLISSSTLPDYCPICGHDNQFYKPLNNNKEL